MHLTFEEFDDPRVSYGFFGRKGGVSDGIYSSLNASLASGDEITAVKENRARIQKVLDIKNLTTPYQVHSPDCIVLTSQSDEKFLGDALVTSTPGVAIGILTADCGPVLFIGDSAKGPVIGAAHAGWGGAVKGVLENTIKKMVEEGAFIETIKSCLGPCIGPESYEVSEGFQTPFFEEDRDSIMYFKPGAPDKLWFDLPAYIKFRLERAGIRNITLSGLDTYKEEDDFFSFRRATHNQEKDYGRELSVISIR
ncbi:MAG: peptidoglycan editing factor PgeF [Micavibrio aeruginosavorus]|uniref:Purine nucleoside phosphorylase n=1 Tax=Micavibrio aeruginosavorus TaxID=349221 RepID=A0A2W5FLU6_9BACT|nr:MAG: peptidoglycan editing factor PgeF [Micavibrio aeruginosavorus]